ncbi:MAG: glycine--tRNA ligase subunit beta, partial [Sulfobacillus sp.]
AGGPLPASDLGWTLAVCLRADELVGGFVAGLEPTGSSDPFGLRRAAQALLSLLQEKRLAWQELVAEAEAGYSLPPNVRAEIGLRVDRFLRSRLEASWREAGHRPEAVAATLGTPLSHPARLFSRLAAVEQMWEDSSFQALITVYRRASRLAEEGPIDPAAGEEAVLKKAVVAAEVAVERQLLQGQDLAALATLASLEGPLERFFDQVMVMDPDPVRRRVRQALLHRVKALSDRLVALSAVAGGREVPS